MSDERKCAELKEKAQAVVDLIDQHDHDAWDARSMFRIALANLKAALQQ